jgi:hypothetical protein
MHAAAYTLMHGLRSHALAGTELAKGSFGTIRWRLLRVAARVTCTACKLCVHLPYSFVCKGIFAKAVALLVPAPVWR